MTQRKLIFKWTLYTLAALLTALFQSFVCNRLIIWGVHPFLLPCLAAIVSTYNGRRESLFFAFFFGFVCDLTITAAIPGFYMLSFCLISLAAGIVSRHLLVPGFFCSLATSALALLINGLLETLVLANRFTAVFGPAMFLLLREILITIFPAMLIHLLVVRIHRYLETV